jgi:heat shock protein HslJ
MHMQPSLIPSRPPAGTEARPPRQRGKRGPSLAGTLASFAVAGLLGACALPQHPDSAAPPTDPYNPAATQLLDDTQWQLTGWTDASGKPRELPASTSTNPLTLQMSTESGTRRASGFSGCNRFTGTYDLRDGKLAFGPLAATRMACPPGGAGALEQPYLDALSHIAKTGVQMKPPQGLQLTLDDGQVLLFARIAR